MTLLRLLLIILLCPGLAIGQQTTFKKQQRGNVVSFAFAWTDATRAAQVLQFGLSANDIAQAQREFGRLDQQEMHIFVAERVRQYAAQNSKGSTVLKIIPNANGYKIEGTGMTEPVFNQHLKAIEQLEENARNDYLKNKFYTSYKKAEKLVLMPDHRRIAARYAPAMKPVANAIAGQVKTRDERQLINYTLNFLQSIPYDQLNSRYTSNGAGFQTPYSLFNTNKGDCDVKSVALAAIMRNLFPKLRMVMVYVPEHAFIGFAIPATKTDYALRIGGTTFVLAEPVGPALTGLGAVAPESLQYLNSGRYSYQEIPL